MNNGATLYRGPSVFTGEPVVAKLQGLLRPSANRKTGPGQQLALVPDRRDAVNALFDGGDAAVCGDCAFRKDGAGDGRRRCYVNPMFVNTMGKAEYPETWGFTTWGLLRLGSYGSPASVPYEVSERLVARHPGKWTGYYQEWKNPRFEAFGELCMASVATLEQAEQAWDLGFRTFRVTGPGEAPTANEIVCPHVTHKLTCLECGLCNGKASGAKSIVNPVHGAGKPAEHFNVLQAFLRGNVIEEAA